MTPAFRISTSVVLGCVAAGLVAASVMAQTAGVGAGVSASGTTQFRDPKTGVVWTPENVSKDSRLESANPPSTPADRAFDPKTQIATAGSIAVQRPSANLMGTVPITAGPSVPIVTLDGPTLQAIPGQRWLTVLYITNNSAAAINPELGCTFTNGGRPVQETRIIVPTAGPGQRLGLPVYGPRTDIFVDRVLCRVISPV
jgi:hypothetical protein